MIQGGRIPDVRLVERARVTDLSESVLRIMAVYFFSFVGMVGCEATMRLPDNHGLLSINTLGISAISSRLRGGTNHQEREAKGNPGLLNVL